MHILVSLHICLNIDWDRRVYCARWTWSYQYRWVTQTLRAYILTSCLTRNQTMCSNARDRNRNSRRNFRKNFRKCRPITRHRFSTNHCIRRAFGWRISSRHLRRNRSRILYRLSTNCKMIRAVVSTCPAIFRCSQYTRTKSHLYESVIQIFLSIVLKIWNIRFLICLCWEMTPIYRGLYWEI